MGTLWTITIFVKNSEVAEAAFDASFAELENLNRVMSDYLSESEVSGIDEVWKPASHHLFSVLGEAKMIAEGTSGAFDPAVGALTKVWRRAFRKMKLPSHDTLHAAGVISGHVLLELDTKEGTSVVRVSKPGVRIDLGGIGKGYALKVIGKLLESDFGIASYLVDAGGDVFTGAAPPGAKGWKIEVRGNDEPLVIEIEKLAVATSGDLHQYVEIGGERYSHILDPRTGRALTSRAAATVVAPDPTLADALASAFCVIEDKVEVERCLEKLPEIGAVRVSRAGKSWEQGMAELRMKGLLPVKENQ